ncbi:Protein FAR1-RELATED SEQUENCE [Abeliophyllum distichum]|uniref:Protein FAR1-RELATED SEQUENCE n=1 Tax=Abeliophyllum distichum TaxID=126358 RepID=A0ABD1RXJ7_9LAMI
MPVQVAPRVIITDQDATISKGISMIMSFTLHRFYLWHILNKFSEKMNVISFNDQYHNLVNIIKQSELPAEFEQHELRALAHQRHAELVANHIDINEKPRVYSASMMDNQMLQIHTKNIFLLFQKKIEKSHFYTCSKRTSFDDVKVYAIQRFVSGNSFDRQCQVTYYTSSDCISCSCRMFDVDELVDNAALTNARSTFLLGEFQNLDIRVKDIDSRGDIGMIRNKTFEETQVVSNLVRAKGCEK